MVIVSSIIYFYLFYPHTHLLHASMHTDICEFNVHILCVYEARSMGWHAYFCFPQRIVWTSSGRLYEVLNTQPFYLVCMVCAYSLSTVPSWGRGHVVASR